MTISQLIYGILVKGISIVSVYALTFVIYNNFAGNQLSYLVVLLTLYNFMILLSKLGNDFVLFRLLFNRSSIEVSSSEDLLSFHKLLSIIVCGVVLVLAAVFLDLYLIDTLLVYVCCLIASQLTIASLQLKIEGKTAMYQFAVTALWQLISPLALLSVNVLWGSKYDLMLSLAMSLLIALIFVQSSKLIKRPITIHKSTNFDYTFSLFHRFKIYRQYVVDTTHATLSQTVDFWSVWSILIIVNFQYSTITPEVGLMLRLSTGLVSVSYPLQIIVSRWSIELLERSESVTRQLILLNLCSFFLGTVVGLGLIYFQAPIFRFFSIETPTLLTAFIILILADVINFSTGYNQAVLQSRGAFATVNFVRTFSFIFTLVGTIIILKLKVYNLVFVPFLLATASKSIFVYYWIYRNA